MGGVQQPTAPHSNPFTAPGREPGEKESPSWSKVYPAWQTLPEQRRYCGGWVLTEADEFTMVETITLNACLCSFLGSAQWPSHGVVRRR